MSALSPELLGFSLGSYLPLVSREWKNGSNSSYNYTPFFHSLLTKGKFRVKKTLTASHRVRLGNPKGLVPEMAP